MSKWTLTAGETETDTLGLILSILVTVLVNALVVYILLGTVAPIFGFGPVSLFESASIWALGVILFQNPIMLNFGKKR